MSYGNPLPPDRGGPRRPRPTGGKPGAGRRVTPTYRPSDPPPTPRPPAEIAGPRPVSARQQAHREGRISGMDIIDRTVPRRAVPAPGTIPPGYRRSHIRDTETTRRGRTRTLDARQRANRRRIDWWGMALRVAIAVLVVEVAATLLFSPRLYVTATTINGNAIVPTERLMSLLQLKPHQNIIRLPVGRMQKAILSEPEIATVAIHRALPGTVRVEVTERQPWASVCLPGGECFTIDHTFVPFRATPEPEPNLPQIRLALPGSDDPAVAPPTITLGKPLHLPGLDIVDTCLAWAAGEKFPVASVEIAADGKLCLNKSDGAQIQLGSSVDLGDKLKSLSTLLSRQPTLRDDPDLAYINLFDKNGPAVMTRTALKAANAAQAKADAASAKLKGVPTGTPEAMSPATAEDGDGTAGSSSVHAVHSSVNHSGGTEKVR